MSATMNSEYTTNAPSDNTQRAPWLPVPSRAISAVEHPCIIKNLDKGITSLGGPVKLSKVSRG
jgi:general transcription factor 3C polypeptide 5 (transcription factor C subunit 1)